MNKKQIQEEYLNLINEKVDEENKIIADAKKTGIWKAGLDSNKELFAEIDEKYARRIAELKEISRKYDLFVCVNSRKNI